VIFFRGSPVNRGGRRGRPVSRCGGQFGGDFEQLGRRRLAADEALGKLAGSFIVNAKNQQNEEQAFHARGGRLTRRGSWHPSFGSLSVDGGEGCFDETCCQCTGQCDG
jgi:hypothetical protein